MKFSNKFGTEKPSIFMELIKEKNKIIKNGGRVFDLSIGTPDFEPEEYIREAVSKAALDPENYKYGITDSPELISAVIDWYKNRCGVELKAENITSVNGSQEGIAHICFPLINEGDVVLVPDPGYQIFSFGPQMAGAEIVKMPLLKENNYLIDFEDISEETAKRAAVMVVSYPSNPTAATADKDFYRRLVDFAKKYDIIVIHDNAYSELVYDGELGGSFLETEGAFDVGIEFNSLSKSYNLTGLRLSFAIGNADIISRFKAFRSQIDYGISGLIQTAAIAALRGDKSSTARLRESYRQRRDFLYEELNKIGWRVPKSPATMFMWLPKPKAYKTSMDFCMDLLYKTGVVLVPGNTFGELGEGHVRLALVLPVEKLKSAVEKIKNSGINLET
ncbi:MAG: aminotransferase class I/II-fold pyridoxal phosphate-dependent enzyme [Clostridiales bacterium]|nr:aminotransferase class I/II-fold pyridoxal phosphate-dependent enzyme [Clostridiales bacterium]